jgi:hypothetical protein
MGWTGAVAGERVKVIRRGISLVPGKPVFRELLVEAEHQPIAGDLCDNGRRGDAGAATVPLDHRRLRVGARDPFSAINEQKVRGEQEPLHRTPHRESRRAQDIQSIDLLDRCFPHADGQGTRTNFSIQALPHQGAQALAVIDPGNGGPGLEDDCCGDDGASQRSSAGLVDAGDHLAGTEAATFLAVQRTQAPHLEVPGDKDTPISPDKLPDSRPAIAGEKTEQSLPNARTLGEVRGNLRDGHVARVYHAPAGAPPPSVHEPNA